MNNWTYDDPAWWVDAIYRCSCPIGGSTYAKRVLESHGEYLPALEEINSTYADALRRISESRESDMNREVAMALLFRAKALRKWRLADPATTTSRRLAAFAGFVRRNEDAGCSDLVPFPYAEHMKMLLSRWLPYDSDLESCVTGRFGPGAVAEGYALPRRLIELQGWCDGTCEPPETGATGDRPSDHWPEVPLPSAQQRSNCARLCAVPKQYDKDRLITVEPCYNSFCQQYVRELLLVSIHRGPLRGTAMDLEYTDGQAIQRRLALKASKNGRLGTLDLSDASDRITWRQVCQVFPSKWLTLLECCRSDRFSIPDESGAEPHTLHIYGGMGNATTFLVETLFFTAFVISYAWAHGLRAYCSTFGDDIITTSEVCNRLSLENFSFFQVNRSKSFYGGSRLRESCGIFAYKGEDITVPRIDGYTHDLNGKIALCDLYRRCMRHPSSVVRRICNCIASEGCIPNLDIEIEGFPSIYHPMFPLASREMLPHRWNKYLQRSEYKVRVLRPCKVAYPTDWRVARRHNTPDPRSLYYATLCGMIGESAQSSKLCRQRYSVSFPVKGRWQSNTAWAVARPLSLSDFGV